jgi:hypothetical protein
MKKKSKLSIMVSGTVLLMSLTLFSCGPGCIEGNGTKDSEIRNVKNFTSILTSGDFDVNIQQDSIYKVEVEGDQNLLPYVVTEIRSSNTLEIRNANNRCLQSNVPIKVTVKTPDLFQVTNSGSGYVACDYVYNNDFSISLSGSGVVDCYKLDTRNLNVVLSGSGNIVLQGKTINSDMKISGSGRIKAYDMDQDECYINLTGSGDAYVFVFDYLHVKIPGSGDVFYRGNPTLDYRIDGSGRVYNNNK